MDSTEVNVLLAFYSLSSGKFLASSCRLVDADLSAAVIYRQRPPHSPLPSKQDRVDVRNLGHPKFAVANSNILLGMCCLPVVCPSKSNICLLFIHCTINLWTSSLEQSCQMWSLTQKWIPTPVLLRSQKYDNLLLPLSH